MSLEQELARNTAAITALTAALQNHRFSEVAPVTIAEIDRLVAPGIPVVHTSTPVVTAAEWAALKETETPKQEVASSEPAATPATPVAAAAIEYAQVAKAITDVFKVDRAKVIEALAKFDAAKGPQLKAEDYAAFLKELGV